jgi:hypothetical protein
MKVRIFITAVTMVQSVQWASDNSLGADASNRPWERAHMTLVQSACTKFVAAGQRSGQYRCE